MKIENFSDVKSFFFDNVSVRQTLLKNTFWLGVADGISKLLKLFLLIYVARILGATEYGKFSFALAFVGLFLAFASLGLPRIIVRELSQGKEKEQDFSSILSLKIFLSLGTLALILAGSFFVSSDPQVRKVVWILALYSLIDNFATFLNFFFHARQKMEYETLSKVVRAALLAVFGFLVILSFPSVENLSYGYLWAGLLGLIFILFFFHLKVYKLTLTFNKAVWQRYLIMSWPLALAGLFSTIYGQIDSVIMGYLHQITETGWYNAAYRIAGGALIPLSLVSTSFYPALSKAFGESKERFQRAWDYQAQTLILLISPMVVGGIILAPKIIDFVYGHSFGPSVLAFQLLILMAGVSALHTPFSHALLVFNQQTKFLWTSLLAAGLSVILNVVLIPRYSLYGAAFAAVITAFSVFLLLAGFSLRFTSIKIINSKLLLTIALIGFATLLMYFVVTSPAIYHLHAVFSITIGTIVYFITFFSLKLMTQRLVGKTL
jgi:O-antigen/teichoic acid export membrane protein